MENVRTIYLDWNGGTFKATGGSQLAYQYDHLSNLVIFSNAPKLDNYYLIVEMKETEDGEVRTFEPIQLAGSFWLVPNSYTQLAQNISFQVCCKTENGDFERHSAQFTGTILPSKDHAGAELDIDPSIMYDPYKQWVFDIAMAAGAIVIDPTLSVQGAAADAKATGDAISETNERLVQQAELTSDLKADAVTSFSWVQGGINTIIGTNTEDNARIRSSGFKSYDGCESVNVTIPSDYQAVAIELNGTGSPQRDYFVRSIPDSGYTAQSFSFVPVEEYYYRFCIKRTSNADISPAQVPSGFAVTEQRKRIPNIFETMFNTNVGNCGILCAKEHNFTDGSAPTYEWYLLGDPATNKVYYSKDMTQKEYLFTFGENLGYWSFGIDSGNNIICCKQSEYLSDSLEHDDGLRINPIVYLFSEKYSIPHEVDFGESLKPCGWLSSVGFICLADGTILIAEYTRPVVSTANIWKISGTPANAENWSVRQTFELSGGGTGFKHIHCVQQDFYTGVCYFSTGDDDTSSHWYYSTDNGTTWVLGKGNSEKYCRFLNLIFTLEYIYWSTDSNKVGYHWMFRAARKSNGVLDFDNITDLLEIPLVANLATYGCCYFPEYKALLLMERCDSEVQMEMPVRLYDIETNTLHNVWTFVPVASRTTGGHLGFRTRFCTWYPKNNAVKCAWHLRGTSLGSRGFNENAMFGNLGMTDASYNINNAEIHIYKDGSTYRMTLDTAYI